MSEQIGEAVINVRTDGSAVPGQLGALGSQGGSRFKGAFGLALGGLGVAAVGAAAAGTAKFFQTAISGASDLQEATSKTNVIFGKGTQAVMDFASQGATALGQTKNQVLEAASNFGIFGKAAGLSGNDLARFSTDFTSLATDLASFHNTSPEEAIVAIGAALRGESEPIRRFGVLLDDASLKAEAMRQGLINTTTQALTPQQRVLAAQALIMKQTADAQGDFERTSGGLANQQRILSASFQDLATKAGTALLPAVTAVVATLNDAMGWLGTLGPTFTSVGDAISSAFSGEGVAGASGFFEALRTSASEILPVLAAFFTGTLLPAFQSLMGFITTTALPVIQQFADIFVNQIIPVLTMVGTFIIGTLVPALYQIVTAVASNLAPIFTAISEVMQNTFLPALSAILVKFQEWWPTIQQVIMIVTALIGAILEFVSQVLGVVLPVMIKLTGALMGGVFVAIQTVIGIIVTLVGAIIDLGTWIGNAVQWFIDFGTKIVNAVDSAVRSVIGFFTGLATDVASKVSGLITDIVGFFGGLPGKVISALSGIGSDIGAKFGEAKSFVTDVIADIVGFYVALPGKIVAALGDLGATVGAKFGDIADAASKIPGQIVDFFSGLAGRILDAIGSIDLGSLIHFPEKGGGIPYVPGVASGTSNFPGGLAVVGEQGPELVRLPSHSQVVPADETLRLFKQFVGAGGGGATINVMLPTGDPEAAALAVMDRLAAAAVM